jgi:hypothetical protein
MTTRDDQRALFNRTQIERLEIDLKVCSLTYGVAPCTAAGAVGSECYNTVATCQDRPNYTLTTQAVKFCHRAGVISPGEDVRPYIVSINSSPTEIQRDKGLAIRGRASIKLTDEPAVDTLDPYRATRATPAGGTYWGRLIARHPNYATLTARLVSGFATEPFTLDAVRTEEQIVASIQGPDMRGTVTVLLADRIKLLDNSKYPPPSKGKLLPPPLLPVKGAEAAMPLPAYTLIAYVRGGFAQAIKFSGDASPVDGEYVGQEVFIASGDGAGQRRVITGYVGESRVAAVGVEWDVIPSSNSTVEVSQLYVLVDNASSYPLSGHVAIGDEVIQYTANFLGVLSWPDSTFRQQFGTDRTDHEAGDKVQQCAVFIDQQAYAVVLALLNAGGIDTGNVDYVALVQAVKNWSWRGPITACIPSPEKVSDLLSELLQDLNIDCWWDAIAAKVRFAANAPEQEWGLTTLTDSEILAGSLMVERQEDQRLTEVAVDYDIRSATAPRGEQNSYLIGESVIDSDAESADEFGDVRQDVRRSRWMTEENRVLVKANAKRKLLRLRNIPLKIRFRLDYRDEVTVGQLVRIYSRGLVGSNGQPRTVTCKITRCDDFGAGQEVEALSAFFSADVDRRRWGFIAPAGTPIYTLTTDEQRAKYGFIADASALMSNGDEGYYIP